MKKQELRLISLSIVIAAVITGIKFYAYYVSRSVVVLSDALESIINIVAGMFAFYSIYLSSKPRDMDHPYGHGKIEFFSIGFEGAMIAFAGIGIIYNSIMHFIHPMPLANLNKALWLIALGGILNGLTGWWFIRRGRQLQSLTLEGNGKHILSDSYSSIGVIVAVAIIDFTGILWVDPLASFIAGGIILVSGFKLLRKSVSGLMDETDLSVIDEILNILNKHRQSAWIDVHNMRVQRYGNSYHVDCHLTLPYYYTLETVHDLVSQMEKTVNDYFSKGKVEFFIHTDPCEPACCHYCDVAHCPARSEAKNMTITWTEENVLPNRKHYAIEAVPEA